MIIHKDLFNKIVQPEALFLAWKEFKHGKGSKIDVLMFESELESNIFKLSRDLKNKSYKHGEYEGFYISDPKLRHIHKATVRDRVLHHAIFNILNPIFEPTFISNSFSCRIGKGTHKGIETLRGMLRKESRNNTKTCYVLKCDVRKFFDSIDHDILLAILNKKIKDPNIIWLLENIIESYTSSASDLLGRKGVPIGNLTSQIFANIYMNEFDQFIKHKLKVRYYARYTDDFVIVSRDRDYLLHILDSVNIFLRDSLFLHLHPEKVEILSYIKGIDFLGNIIFSTHTLIRKRTKKRIIRKFEDKIEAYRRGEVGKDKIKATLASYLGVLSHTDAYKFSIKIKNYFYLWVSE
ncbi:group II intron reverse transcriptase domain-containing protein [Candidatus Nomurabacteria bacterium]|nr:group II intron reverse transcriptase domain-containing protein [Candidatus Nomurabacteria bacterium]